MGHTKYGENLRRKICLECPAKCEIYLRKQKPKFSPVKTHKVHFGGVWYKEFMSRDLYVKCKYYDPLEAVKGLVSIVSSDSA